MNTRNQTSGTRFLGATVVAISFLGGSTGCANLEGGKVGPATGAECPTDGQKPAEWKKPAVVAGQRYYLPKPFVVYQLDPKDGSLKASVEYMPDVTRQYAVQARSYAGKHTLNVERNPDGTLKKIVYKPDASAVAAKAAEASGNVAKAAIDKLAANKVAEAAEEKKAAEEAAAKKDKVELAGMKASVDATKRDLDAAKESLAGLKTKMDAAETASSAAEAAAKEAEIKAAAPGATQETKTDAIVKRAKAQSAKEEYARLQARYDLSAPSYDAQQRAYDEIKKKYDERVAATSNDPGAANLNPGGGGGNPDGPKPPTTRRVYGPMVYAVNEVGATGVRLVPVTIVDRAIGADGKAGSSTAGAGQRDYLTTNLNIVVPAAAAAGQEIAFTIDPKPDANQVITLTERAFTIKKVTGDHKKVFVKIFKKTGEDPVQTNEFEQLVEGTVHVVQLNEKVKPENQTPVDHTLMVSVDKENSSVTYKLRVTK